jgi:phage shock protein PspC (stress-responsive transcriptional regulator)/multisubunit Na+/H+ antiporter MnhG subunit
MENEQRTPTESQEGESISDPAPPPHAPPIAKRLAKRRDAGWFTGVSAGAGAYAGIDPNWVRLGFVVLTFIGGIGAAVYVLAMFFLPDATTEEAAAQPIAERPYNEKWTTKEWYLGSGKWFSIIAFIVLACSVGSAWDVGGFSFMLALLLAGAGIYFLSDAERASDVRERLFGGPRPAGARPADATASPASAYAIPAAYRPAPDPEQQRRREQYEACRRQARHDRRVLKSITVGAALSTVGVMAILDFADVHDFAFSSGLAAALLVLGAGIVVGAWRGRSYSLIALALLLTPFVMASSTVDGMIYDGAGEQKWRPADTSELRADYRFGAGRAELDLTAIRLDPSETRVVRVDMNSGLLVVKLPPSVGYEVTAEADYGSLDVLDVDDGSVESDNVIQRSAPGAGTIVLDASIDKGRIVIDRSGEHQQPQQQSETATTEVNQ